MIITDVYGNTFSGNGRRCRIPLFADRQEGVPALVSSGGICGVSSRLVYHSPTGDIEVISRSIATKKNTSPATTVILFAVALSLATHHSCLATYTNPLATRANALATHHSCLATRANTLATRYFYSAVDKNASFIRHFHYNDDKTIAQNGAKQLKGNYSEYFTTYFYN
ncbi:MAG: hypothetical protein ACFNUH_08550 [Bacteroidota bacterium]